MVDCMVYNLYYNLLLGMGNRDIEVLFFMVYEFGMDLYMVECMEQEYYCMVGRNLVGFYMVICLFVGLYDYLI